MSNETTAGTETDRERRRSESRLAGLDAAVTVDRRRLVYGAGLVALLTVAAKTVLRVLHNLPFEPVSVPGPVWNGLSVALPFVLALALVAVAVTTDRAPIRVGLLFAAVFAPLASVRSAATLPAVVALVGGGTVAIAGSLGTPSSYRELRRGAIAAGFLGAITVSLGSAVGILDGGYQTLGALLALTALAGVGLLADSDGPALLAGAAVFGAISFASVSSPYVAGSALLVAFAVVGVPPIVAAVAAGAGTAAAVAGLRRGEYTLAVGVVLLVFAGVPATLPRAMAVLLGATLVCLDVRALAGASADEQGVTA